MLSHSGLNLQTETLVKASCESFIKTLKREEIYASRYENLEDLCANVENFIEDYYVVLEAAPSECDFGTTWASDLRFGRYPSS